METTDTLSISSSSLSDHIGRLYDKWESDGTTFHHVDGEASGVIVIIKENAKTTKVTMTSNALREFIDDMKYQVEIYEDCAFERAYMAQCKRALMSVKKQINNNRER